MIRYTQFIIKEKYNSRVEEFISKISELMKEEELGNSEILSELGDMANRYDITADEIQSIINDRLFDSITNNLLEIILEDTNEIDYGENLDKGLKNILNDLVAMGLEEVPLSDEMRIGELDMLDAISKIKKLFRENA